jgi:hypothetical protein
MLHGITLYYIMCVCVCARVCVLLRLSLCRSACLCDFASSLVLFGAKWSRPLPGPPSLAMEPRLSLNGIAWVGAGATGWSLSVAYCASAHD